MNTCKRKNLSIPQEKQQKKKKRRNKAIIKPPKAINKKAMNPYLSIVTLNVSRLNSPIKSQSG